MFAPLHTSEPKTHAAPAQDKPTPFFQPKLTVNIPGDAHEQQADRVADQVMRMSQGDTPIAQRISFTTISPSGEAAQRKEKPVPHFFGNEPIVVQRKCAECEKEEKEGVQRKETASAGGHTAPPIVSETLSSGGGQPMDGGTRQFMESRFGQDFSQVRIHTDSRAAESAQAIQARAYTSGRDVVFGAGEYQPESESGRRLLAHELVHVGQQGESSKREKISRRVIPQNVVHNEAQALRLGMDRQQVIEAISEAEAEAVGLATAAENALRENLASVIAGNPVDEAFDTILQEELGLTLSNRSHFGLIRQQANRFQRVRETLQSGYLRYLSIGIGTVSLVGCTTGSCGIDFAFTCPGNRLMVLCQPFWDEPNQRAATILHEPFHIWFDMERHADNALRRADSSCFESFALRVSEQEAFASCVAHTNG